MAKKASDDDHAAAADPPPEETESEDHDDGLIQVELWIFIYISKVLKKSFSSNAQ